MIRKIKKLLFMISLFAVMIVITILGGYFIHKTYTAYKTYQISKHSKEYLSWIKKFDTLLKDIENERLLSALYLSTNGNTDFNRLKKARDETDMVFKNLNNYIKKSQKFQDDLQYVRSRVDVINDDYESILFSYYQDELSSPIIKELTSKIENLSLVDQNSKNDLYRYKKLIEDRNSINIEKSFIAYILNSSKKMSDKDLLIWEDILSNNRSSYSTSLSKQRVAFAKGISNGDYQIDIKKWLQSNEKIQQDLQYSKNNLFNQIESNLTNDTYFPKELLYYFVISLLLIFILFKIFAIRKRDFRKKDDGDIIQNSEIVRKKRATDRPKTDNSQQIQNIADIEKRRATDIPLTNIQKRETYEKSDLDYPVSFNPVEEFARIINQFKEKTLEKDIGFIYKIDPTIPTHCIGEISKINRALLHLLRYTIQSSNYKNIITLSIENIAQTKFENAIRFSLKQTNSNFTEDEIKKIHSAKHPVIYNEMKKKIKLNPAKENLVKINKIISTISGNFKIISDKKNETDLQITVNLKRE